MRPTKFPHQSRYGAPSFAISGFRDRWLQPLGIAFLSGLDGSFVQRRRRIAEKNLRLSEGHEAAAIRDVTPNTVVSAGVVCKTTRPLQRGFADPAALARIDP